MQRHHKILLAAALLVAVVAWLAWNVLLVDSDLVPGG